MKIIQETINKVLLEFLQFEILSKKKPFTFERLLDLGRRYEKPFPVFHISSYV